jgi:oligopeptide transport system permease protein
VGTTGGWIGRGAARLIEAALTLLALFTLSFLVMRFAPGSPFDRERPLAPAVRAALEARYGLDQPLAAQYLSTLKGFVTLDLGPSLVHPERGGVMSLLSESLARSLELGAWGFALAVAFGLLLALGTAAAARPWQREALRAVSQVGLVVPVIALGPFLVEVFAVRLGWLPPGGFDRAACRVLPATVLGLVYGAVFYRLFLGGLDDTLRRPWPLLLAALGVPRRRVVVRHVLPASLSPFVSYLGPALSGLLTGSFVVERVFNIPGLSVHFVDATQERDYPVILAVVMLYAGLLVTLNLAADLLAAALDPRLRHGATTRR